MKILVVTEYFPPLLFGGGEMSCYLLAKNLVKLGQEVHVLTSYFKGLKQVEVKEGITVIRRLKTGKNAEGVIENIKRLGFYVSVKKECIKLNKETRYDLIFCYNVTSMVGVAEAKEILKRINSKIKLIAHINTPLNICPTGNLIMEGKECKEVCNFGKFVACLFRSKEIGKMKNRIYFKFNPLFWIIVYINFLKRKNSLKQFDFITALSYFIKNLLIKNGINKNKIEAIHNIIELDDFFKIKPRQKSKKINLLYTGAYAEFKGPHILLKALNDINIDYECNLYGGGYFKKELIKLKKKFNLIANINDWVEQPKLPTIYEKADIVIFPSIWPEPLGRVHLEAMAAARPVIASNTGGIPEVVIDKKTGLLVNPKNPKELRDAISKLAKDSLLRNKMGLEGRKLFKERFNADVLSKKFISVFERVIS